MENHDHHQHHQDLINDMVLELQDIFDHSDQGIYVYLDEEHKACNKKFATWLGYETPKAWAGVTDSFTDAFVDKKSQERLVSSYTSAMEKRVGSSFPVTWKKKSGGTLDSTVILVPVSFEGHLFALHFITN